MKTKWLICLTLFVLVGCSSKVTENYAAPLLELEAKDEGTVRVYKSASCGCCVGYADELERQGFDVQIIVTEDMEAVRQRHSIPQELGSCHTTVIDDYFVEGHVPMEAVKKLLTEKPNIDGIGLPRMPTGTPGMPGPKRGPYQVYGLTDGGYQEFVTI